MKTGKYILLCILFQFIFLISIFSENKDNLTFSYCKSLKGKAKDQCMDEMPLAPVQKDGKWGYIDIRGELVIPFKFFNAREFSGGLAAVQTDQKENKKLDFIEEKWSFINKQGIAITSTGYETVGDFSEELAAVPGKDGKYGYIDKKGKQVISHQFVNATPFNGGLALAKQKGFWGYINTKGKFVISPEFDGARPFSEDLAAVSNMTMKWGYTDKKGNMAIPYTYYSAASFKSGHAVVCETDQCGIIDKKGNVVLPMKYKSLKRISSEYYAVNISGNKWGVIDIKGNFIIPAVYDYIGSFSEGLIEAGNSKGDTLMAGFINLKNEVIIPFIYEPMRFGPFTPVFSYGLVPVIKDGKTGYIDKTGKVVIHFQFEKGGNFTR